MENNPWSKGGKYYPNWIDEDKQFFKQNADYVLGNQNFAPIREKNPMTLEWISDEELTAFDKIFEKIPTGNPYKLLRETLEKLTKLQFPELPSDIRLQANWNLMFSTWFFEKNPSFNNAYWVNKSKIIFRDVSLYSADLVNSVSFSDINNRYCIKHQFFKYSDKNRSNPLRVSFSFNGRDSGKENYYSWVEWFVGSYSTNINWTKKENGGYDIFARIDNVSSWYSGSRLPKSWQDKIKKTIGFEIKNLVDSAPRGETIRRKMPYQIARTIQLMGINIPSFGGNWEQEFNIKTHWQV